MNILRLLVMVLLIGPAAGWCQSAPFSRGVNLTNWFQAPSAQQISFNRYSKQDFEQIRNLGCDVIRLPINLHAMTGGAPDYTLDPLFLRHLGEAVGWAEALEMHIVLDNHSFDPAVNTDPAIRDVLLNVWPQLAEHFRERSEYVVYEVLNEPHGIDDSTWNSIQQDVVAAIRGVDATHTIIIGGAGWNSYHNLDAMPVYDDDNLVYTFHFYDPFLFTHQGASWVEPSMVPLADVPFPYDADRMPPLPPSLSGSWIGDAYRRYAEEGTVASVQELLDIAVRFREERGAPLFLGELGVLMNQAPAEDRVFWYRTVREYLDEHQIAWTAWDYHGGFGLFERGSGGQYEHDLNLPLLEALGLDAPPQTPPVSRPDTIGFTIYGDAPGDGVVPSSNGSGTLDPDSAADPYEGNRAIHWSGPDRYDTVGFDFSPDRDLSFLLDRGYALELAVRGDTPGVALTVRFIDSDTEDESDRPWRMAAVVSDSLVDWNGDWQTVRIPLSALAEQGAWEDGQWYDPEGRFDWTKIDRFDIVAEDAALPGVTLGFDRIRVTREAPAPPALSDRDGLNGLFFDPAAPGHGFDFNYVDGGLVAFYYGHTASAERLWLISETWAGAVEFGVPLELAFYEVAEGSFGVPASEVTTYWGTIRITLDSCTTGSAEFDGIDGQLSMPLVRLAGVRGLGCSQARSYAR